MENKYLLSAFADEAGDTAEEQIAALKANDMSLIEVRLFGSQFICQMPLDEVKEIKRFTSSIIQNMVKGNAELTKFLREMSDEMWNEKKNMVKRKGEIANSKLLVPIMLIFIGILIVIMVPMFTSM